MKVKEVMSKEVFSISPEMRVKEALKLLFEKHISGLPVIDFGGKLVGMFTEKDVLGHILPSYLERVGSFVYEMDSKTIKKKFQDLENLTVAQVMRKEVISVDEETILCEAARLMLTHKARRIPVLNKEKKVVGIIAREDILKAYAKEAELI